MSESGIVNNGSHPRQKRSEVENDSGSILNNQYDFQSGGWSLRLAP